MSSDLNLELTDSEAKKLWKYLSGTEDDLDLTLSSVRRRLESLLWDRLSIEEMALVGSGSEA